MTKELFVTLWQTYKYNLICILFAVVCFIGMCFAMRSCSNAKTESVANIHALVDSIEYYKTKSGQTAASKSLLIGELSTLKLVNDSLYKVIKDMKISDPSSVVYINSTIDNGKKDTAWIVKKEQITNSDVTKSFAFNNEYRTLEGSVSYKDSILGLQIDTDKVYFDYTLAVEGSKVYLKSNNPYVKFNDITGLTVPTYTKKKWSLGIGPSIGYGYDFVAKRCNPYIGIGINLQYNLLSW